MSDIEDMQAERRAWAEYERGQGWSSGFICGVGLTCVVLLVTLLIVGYFS